MENSTRLHYICGNHQKQLVILFYRDYYESWKVVLACLDYVIILSFLHAL